MTTPVKPTVLEARDISSTPAFQPLLTRRQWVAWDLRYKPDRGEWVKIPISPRTGWPAKSNDKSTWGTYAEAAARAKKDNLSGIGLMLASDDDLNGIDLDKVRDPESGEFTPWAAELLAHAETYAELSPSGRGIRLFSLGKVDAAVKSNAAQVEIYGTGRYLTVTGHHLAGTPEEICSAPNTLADLRARVESFKPAPPEPIATSRGLTPSSPVEISGDKPSDFFDRVKQAAMARLDAWVPVLFPGAKHQPGTGGYRITSRQLGRNLQEDLSIHPDGIKDWGVADMGDPRGGNRTAIDLVQDYGHASTPLDAARWLCGQLAIDYDALWRETHPAPDIEINLGGQKIAVVKGVPVDAETGEVIGEKPAPRDDYAADLMRWGGLVPEIARHILANSRRPQPTFAVMAALSVISVAAGRQMIAPLGSNLNLFVVLITRSANGKEAPIKLAPAILREAGLGVMVAPTGGFASDIGLYGWMHKHPVTVWPANEFGDKLAELTAKGNSPNLKKIIGALRELYDGGHIDSSEAALRNSVTLLNPCLSVLAASTPEQFFDVIGSKLIKDGTLNRFMAVYAPKRVRKQDPVEAELPQDIKDALMAIANRPGSLSSGRFYLGCCDQDPGKPYRIPWALGDAKARWDAYEDEIIDRSEKDKMVDDLAGRCAQNALRVASLLAISDDWQDPRVSLKHIEMGIRIADQSLADTIAGMRDYVPEGPWAALQEKIRQKIAAKGVISHRDLLRTMKASVKNSKELTDLILLLEEGGDILKTTTSPEGGGPKTVFYQIRKDAA